MIDAARCVKRSEGFWGNQRMDIEEAVGTLNKHRWRGKGFWNVQGGCAVASNVPRAISIAAVDGIAIASWLELREAVEPFLRYATT